MLVHPDDVQRLNFARSNFIVELSPYQLWTPDPHGASPWADMVGRDLFNDTFGIINSMVKAGAVTCYGSDWDNVPEPDPWLGLEGMITRQFPGKPEYGRFNPEERIGVETAIEIFTRNGAVAMEKEDETGSIEPGKSADFIVINQNILKIPVEEIHKTKVLQTVLQGKMVYEKK